VIQYGVEFIQSFGTASGLIETFVVNRKAKREYKSKSPLAEQLQKYGRFQNFPPAKIARYQVSSEVLVTERKPATSVRLLPAIGPRS
jgi:hypothetical protein